MLVNISDIKVKKRVRLDMGDLEPLKNSLKRYGLLNPITINNKYELVAGGRRLEAAKAIGWININAIMIDSMDPITELEMELEENNQRKSFTDAELLSGYRRMIRLQNPNIFVRIWNAIKNFFKSLWKRKPKDNK